MTLEELKEKYPIDGEHNVYYSYTWYDSYFYLDNKWFLGKETWDGIVQAEEPSYELNRFEYSIKTKKDVIDFIKDKLDITKF